ncbi:UNVERIFIED_ORG: hypothetical protein J2X79_004269 [Arthrobacter globiformis]|nr:hypothetical protein [Arthrobacter globiformis]
MKLNAGAIVTEISIIPELDQLADDLIEMTADVVASEQVASPDLRTVLRFINNIVQIVDEAFQDVYSVLVDLSLLKYSDMNSQHIASMQSSVERLTSRSRYRDAKEICSRLHYLSEDFESTIGPIIDGTSSRDRWQQVFYLLEEHEGRIIRLVEFTVSQLRNLFSNSPAMPDVLSIAELARLRAEEVGAALDKLQELRNQILGLSGKRGLMYLISAKERTAGAAASLIIKEFRVGDTYKVRAAGAVGPHASASNTNIHQMPQQQTNPDTVALARELELLRVELQAHARMADQSLVTGEVAAAQIEAEKGDHAAALGHLARAGKWALDTATSIGATIAAAAIKTAMGM